MERGGGHDGEELPDVQPVLLLLRAEGEEEGDQAVRQYLLISMYSYLLISTYLPVWKVLGCEEAAVLAAAGLGGGHQPRAAPRRRQGQPDRYLDIYLSKYLTI